MWWLAVAYPFLIAQVGVERRTPLVIDDAEHHAFNDADVSLSHPDYHRRLRRLT